MTYTTIDADWVSNGRVLPTAAERDAMTDALREAASQVASSCNNGNLDELADTAVEHVRQHPEMCGLDGWTERDIRRVLADCLVTVR